MSLHITVTNEDGKTVIDDDTTMLALVLMSEATKMHGTCVSACLGRGSVFHCSTLVRAMDALRADILKDDPRLAAFLALRDAVDNTAEKIDVSALYRASTERGAPGHVAEEGGDR